MITNRDPVREASAENAIVEKRERIPFSTSPAIKAASRSMHLMCFLMTTFMTPVCAQTQGSSSPEPDGLFAPEGITALSGRVVDAQGNGLPDVRVLDNAATAFTDAFGRFLLFPVVVGASVIQIDGRHVGRGIGLDYGFYELKAYAQSGQTTKLGFKSWLSLIDHSHYVKIGSPTSAEVVVRSPAIQGLELRLPAGTIIRGPDGEIVTEVGITVLPSGRQPYPMPATVGLPFGYTIQPGGSCLYNAAGGVGYGRITYPNVYHHLPRAREMFWDYEPDRDGWRQIGAGQVSTDGTQVIPDRDTVITDFYSAECEPQTRSHPLVFDAPLAAPHGVLP